jgi:hypothetical protein
MLYSNGGDLGHSRGAATRPYSVCCVPQNAGGDHGCTYHSPLGSVRAEPALLPAAAEAKEAGAIVVAGEAWKVRCGVEAVSFVLGGTRQTDGGSCGWIVSGRRWCQAASRVGWSGGRGKSGTRVYWYTVQANGRGSRRMATVERIPVSAARKPKSRHVTSTLNFDDVAPALQRQTTRLTRLGILERQRLNATPYLRTATAMLCASRQVALAESTCVRWSSLAVSDPRNRS